MPEKPKKTFPSRKKVKYVAIPKEYHQLLEQIGEPEERSVQYLVRRAIREWFEKNGHIPPKPGSSK